MTLHRFSLLVLPILLLPLLAPSANADTLNTANAFAVLAGSTVTNAAYATIIDGDLGVSPGAAVSGFPPGIVNGSIYTGTNAVAIQAQSDLTTAFTTLQTLGLAGLLVPGGVLNGTYTPGVYFAPAASLTGTIFLNDGGVAGSQFIFYSDSSLITAPDSAVDVSGLSPSDSLFWVVNSSATLGVRSAFQGNILALTSISFDPGATIACGRALARNGQVSFAGQDPASGIQNHVSIGCLGTPGEGGSGFNGSGGPPPVRVPEPGTFALLLSGLLPIALLTLRKVR